MAFRVVRLRARSTLSATVHSQAFQEETEKANAKALEPGTRRQSC